MKKILILITVLLVIGIIGAMVFFNKPQVTAKTYQDIKTENKGAYIVRNVKYTGTAMDVADLEKVMQQIRGECQKPCKINLYADTEAYNLDIQAGESNFDGYTDAQKNYMKKHILAFWGIGEGDIIEYYPTE